MVHLEEGEASHEQNNGSINRNIRKEQSPPPLEMQEEDPSLFNKTVSIRDIYMMKAKSYQNISRLENKKYYHCEMCDFKVAAFEGLRAHLRKTHLENLSQ